jgi:hypothetical protein
MRSSDFCVVACAVALALAGCNKKPDTAIAPVAAPEVAAPAATATETVAENPDLAAKRKALDFALMEDSYKNDPHGQWAVSAKASSTYAGSEADQTAGYHPFRATGAPDSQTYGDQSTAWATKDQDAGIEWIELEYPKPANATEIRIRQNNAPGAIVKVELLDENSAAHVVWQGPDATIYPTGEIAWLNVKFEKTNFTTRRVKITLATNVVSGWNEIDAVQLVGE